MSGETLTPTMYLDHLSLVVDIMHGRVSDLATAHHLLPESFRWLCYWASVDLHPPGRLTEPDPDTSFLPMIKLSLDNARAATAQLRAQGVVKMRTAEGARVAHRNRAPAVWVFPDEALMKAAHVVHVADKEMRISWYQEDDPHFLRRMKRTQPWWWNRLRNVLGSHAGLPADPATISPPPYSPPTWHRFLKNCGVPSRCRSEHLPCISQPTSAEVSIPA